MGQLQKKSLIILYIEPSIFSWLLTNNFYTHSKKKYYFQEHVEISLFPLFNVWRVQIKIHQTLHHGQLQIV